MMNLDLACAAAARAAATEKSTARERVALDAASTLRQQGVYAFFCYCSDAATGYTRERAELKRLALDILESACVTVGAQNSIPSADTLPDLLRAREILTCLLDYAYVYARGAGEATPAEPAP